MAEVTVTQFAEVLKVPVDKLLAQLGEAGIKVGGADDIISEEAKMELLTHLRRAHGRQGEDAAAPRKITLQRKSQQEIKLASHAGPCPHRRGRGPAQEDLPQPLRDRGRAAPAPGGSRQVPPGRRGHAPGAGARRGRAPRRRAARARPSRGRRAPRAGRRCARAARKPMRASPPSSRLASVPNAASASVPTRSAARPSRRVRRRPRVRRSRRRAGRPPRARRPSTAGRNCTFPPTPRPTSRRSSSRRAVTAVPATSRSRPATASSSPPRRSSATCRFPRRSPSASSPTAWRSRPTKSSRR